MIIASVKAPPPAPPKCLCTVAETALFKESVKVKPADVRNDIALGVSVSVTVR
jgi:hypothetical protein